LLLNCSAAVVVFVLPRVCHRVCSGDTPLHNSAGEGNVDAYDILLKSGADVNAKNNE
jgi:ankyrin repeat protein